MNKYVEVTTTAGTRLSFYPFELAWLESPEQGRTHSGAKIALKCGRVISTREKYDEVQSKLWRAKSTADYGSVMDNQVK